MYTNKIISAKIMFRNRVKNKTVITNHTLSREYMYSFWEREILD